MAYGRLVNSPSAAAEWVGLFKHQLRLSNLQPGELCIVVTDTAFNPLYAAACLGAALDLGADAYQVTLPHTHPLPSRSLGAAWQEADLVVYSSTYALHYSDHMGQALAEGTRALMAVQPLHVLQRLTADPDVIRRTRAGAGLLAAADNIRITSGVGTDLTMRKGSRPGVANCGVADIPGKVDFWGAAMVETAQLEGTLEGVLVLDVGDVIFHLGRFVERPTTLTFRAGQLVDVGGGLDAFLLRTFLESFDEPSSLRAGHTSWGTDRRAQWLAPAIRFPDDDAGGADTEAYYGNVQIEIGSNNDLNFRGANPAKAHLGLCMRGCSLSLDGNPILRDGQFVMPELRA